MKKILILLGFLMLTLQGGCQEPDHDFKVPIYVVKIVFPDSTEMTSALTSASASTWDNITGKPTVFPPASHTHTVAEITDMASVELQTALSALNVMILDKLTTTQINALTPTAGRIVFDTTLGVLKLGNGTVWKTLITSN